MRERIVGLTSYVTIIILVATITVAAVIFGLALYDTSGEKNDLEDQLAEIEQTKDSIASNADDSQTSFQNRIDELEEEVTILRTQVDELEGIAQPGYGVISGQVAQIIVDSDDSSNYQVICAQSSENSARVYCASTPSVRRSYEIIVPVGEYIIFATPYNSDVVGSSTQAYYTEYVACLQSGEDSCGESDEPLVVQVVEGEELTGIDPVDIL